MGLGDVSCDNLNGVYAYGQFNDYFGGGRARGEAGTTEARAWKPAK